MKTFLGLLLLSVLLISGSSLECDTCMAQANDCTGKKQPCSSGQDRCLDALTVFTMDAPSPSKITSRVKSCFTKIECEKLKPGSSVNFGMVGAVLKNIECSRAPVISGSFFLALSSFLFLKLLW
ncbi:phospholipase A2 inhibitor PIP-like [Sphaerodactylus townsendi]|uniref:phospholipase A2 inhibitor PIP-like n=1 Tax=Sphaerodactylus townsendi TaxID=933632 RepID=UPI002026503E|nr:phospholipase A2 inhibitor PIP-like [Sphaerodactylus townsendi]XP_048355095.1 phospholipase A2 inhibitor PIP-like [Sphaerodactylus townsendi]